MEAPKKEAPGGDEALYLIITRSLCSGKETVKSQSGDITGKWGKTGVVLRSIFTHMNFFGNHSRQVREYKSGIAIGAFWLRSVGGF